MAGSEPVQRIAPAPPPSDIASGNPPRPSPTLRTRKKVTYACFACKARKTKCTGTQPCDACLRHNTECVIDPSIDNRSQSQLKRKIADLEQDQELLVRLVSELREGGRKHVLQLLNLIRSNATAEEITFFLEDRFRNNELEKTPELDEIFSEVENLRRATAQRRAQSMLDLKRISDIPLFRVPAKPWTTVTDHDDFVSHLISLWFMWTHPIFSWIDRDMFIKDMQSANRNARYCSPFLVNIILADACAYSDYPETLAVLDDPFSKGLHFYEEAQKELSREAGKITITTLQAMCVLWACTNLMGKDRLGWMYQNQLHFAIKEFTRSHRSRRRDSKEEEALVEARIIDNTIWGIHNLARLLFPNTVIAASGNSLTAAKTSASSLTFQKPPLLTTPPPARLPVDHDNPGDVWFPYPSQEEEGFEGHLSCIFNSLCDLTEITTEINRILFSEEPENVPSKSNKPILDDIYDRLQEWRADLPPCLIPEDGSVPHVIALHFPREPEAALTKYCDGSMYFHIHIVTIFGLSKRNPSATTSLSQTESTETVLAAAREVSQLSEMHRAAWGVERVPPCTIQWIIIAMFALLPHLGAAETGEEGMDMELEEGEDNRTSFVHLCIAARASARRWPLGRGVLRLVQLTARQMDIALPVETEALFKDFEERVWSKEERDRFSSAYPNFLATADVVRDDEGDVELDKFLKKWDDWSIQADGEVDEEVNLSVDSDVEV